MTTNIVISIFLKKGEERLHAIISLNLYKNKRFYFPEFDYNKDKNFYSFSVLQDVACQFNLLPLPLLLLH
jgi:hypothetical protein